MHTVLVVFFAVLAAWVVVVALAFGVAAAIAARRRASPAEARERRLERALSVDRPWVCVAEYALPGPAAARRIARERGYVLRGIERSRGLLRTPLHVFVPLEVHRPRR